MAGVRAHVEFLCLGHYVVVARYAISRDFRIYLSSEPLELCPLRFILAIVYQVSGEHHHVRRSGVDPFHGLEHGGDFIVHVLVLGCESELWVRYLVDYDRLAGIA